MLSAASTTRVGRVWDAPLTSLFTRIGSVHERPPSADFEKKMSCCVEGPPHPAYAT
jgi:hypothetical protein